MSKDFRRSKTTSARIWKLWRQFARELHRLLVAGGGRDVVAQLYAPPPRPILHIGHPNGVHFNPPWNYVYDIVLPDTPVRNVPLCPLVEDWDEKSPLVAEPT